MDHAPKKDSVMDPERQEGPRDGPREDEGSNQGMFSNFCTIKKKFPFFSNGIFAFEDDVVL